MRAAALTRRWCRLACMPAIVPAIVMAALAIAQPLHAEIRMQGKFTAEQPCQAVVSIRKQTNPDKTRLTPDRVYAVLAANAQPATHYRLRVPGARPRERWVAADCGHLGSRKVAPPGPVTKPARGPEYVLALTWQAAFCQMRRNKPECAGQTVRRFDADHFSLHGLWPQPRSNVYCGVSSHESKRRWSRIPPLELSGRTRSDLQRMMPGTASNLQRHEWLKHGSCYGKPADAYFRDALALLQQVNDSALQRLFAENIGERLTAAEIRAAADQSFGRGSGARVVVNCRSGMITELQIQLRGTIDSDSDIGSLMRAAATAPVRCTAGRVDAVGFAR